MSLQIIIISDLIVHTVMLYLSENKYFTVYCLLEAITAALIGVILQAEAAVFYLTLAAVITAAIMAVITAAIMTAAAVYLTSAAAVITTAVTTVDLMAAVITADQITAVITVAAIQAAAGIPAVAVDTITEQPYRDRSERKMNYLYFSTSFIFYVHSRCSYLTVLSTTET